MFNSFHNKINLHAHTKIYTHKESISQIVHTELEQRKREKSITNTAERSLYRRMHTEIDKIQNDRQTRTHTLTRTRARALSDRHKRIANCPSWRTIFHSLLLSTHPQYIEWMKDRKKVQKPKLHLDDPFCDTIRLQKTNN